MVLSTMIVTAVTSFKSDPPSKLSYIESSPNIERAEGYCRSTPPVSPKPLELTQLYRLGCVMTHFSSAIRAISKEKLFESKIWQEYKNLTTRLSDQELIGWAGMDKQYVVWTVCNIAAYKYKSPQPEIVSTRDILLLRSFLNLVGGKHNLSKVMAKNYKLEKKRLIHDMNIFKRINRLTPPGSGLLTQYLPYSYIYIRNNEGMKQAEKYTASTGKWVVFTDSQEKATRIAEALIGCFKSNQLTALKFDIKPFGGTYRVIVYSSIDHDPNVSTILKKLTNKDLVWIYESQCVDGMSLEEALMNFIEIAKKEMKPLNTDQMNDLLKKVEDKKFMSSLGLNESQRQILLAGLLLEDPPDLSNQAIHMAYASFHNSTPYWTLFEIALRPENQSDFRRILVAAEKKDQLIKTRRPEIYK